MMTRRSVDKAPCTEGVEYDVENPERPVEGICNRCEVMRLSDVVVLRNCEITRLKMNAERDTDYPLSVPIPELEDIADQLEAEAMQYEKPSALHSPERNAAFAEAAEAKRAAAIALREAILRHASDANQ